MMRRVEDIGSDLFN